MSESVQSTPVTRKTRSGRSVKEPTRYEPDPDAILEDDFSDSDCGYESEEDGYSEEELPIEDDEYMSDSSESDDEDDDMAETMSTTVERSLENGEPGCPSDDEDEEDVLDWDCLTDDATDGSESSDEEL